LKKGSRARQFWHKRYFIFDSENRLLYFHRKEDRRPKGSYAINKLNDCDVSELFVEKHHKKLVYCIRITWSNSSDESAIMEESQFSDDNSSFSDGFSQSIQKTNEIQSQAPISQLPTEALRQSSGSLSAQTTRSLKPGKAEHGCSVDGESLTLGTRRPLHIQTVDKDEGNETLPRIPQLVEVNRKVTINDTEGSGLVAVPVADHMPKRNHYQDEQNEEQEMLRAEYFTARKISQKRAKQKVVSGTKIAAATGAAIGVTIFTAGISLVAGLVALSFGAAAGGGGAVADLSWGKKKKGEITIACSDYNRARRWKAYLDASLESTSLQKSTWGQLFVSDGRKTRTAVFPGGTRSMDSLAELKGTDHGSSNRAVLIERDSIWTPVDGGWALFLGSSLQGLRIFREERNSLTHQRREMSRQFATDLSVDGRPCPPLKSYMVLSATPLDAFLCLMTCGRIVDGAPEFSPNSGQRASFRVVENIDDHTDVIHLMCRPLYLFPSWTSPRDFVLYRCWRLEEDGSYNVCLESLEHADCPPTAGYVRGGLHQVYTISPHKKLGRRRADAGKVPQECLMTAVAQVDPKGWIPVTPLPLLCSQAYGDAFGFGALFQLLDIRDAIDQERFVAVDHETKYVPTSSSSFANDALRQSFSMEEDPLNYDFSYVGRESLRVEEVMTSSTGFTVNPSPLESNQWAEPDSNSFRVRGKNYLQDKKKINAGPSIGRLVAVDVVAVDQPIFSGMTTHPKERLQLALKKESLLTDKGQESDLPPFIFVMNIVLPGPPFYHGVFYYAVDNMSAIDGTSGTPSSKLCNKFFFGECDEFRDRTFKLIPQIVHGNFIVRKAVGSTPAIMGKKLRQFYVKTERSFEIVLDCGSSQVATGVIRLSLGYAKTLVVDMGFVFEGGDDEVLPERLFGCVRMKQIDFGPTLRKVATPSLPRLSENY